MAYPLLLIRRVALVLVVIAIVTAIDGGCIAHSIIVAFRGLAAHFIQVTGGAQ